MLVVLVFYNSGREGVHSNKDMVLKQHNLSWPRRTSLTKTEDSERLMLTRNCSCIGLGLCVGSSVKCFRGLVNKILIGALLLGVCTAGSSVKAGRMTSQSLVNLPKLYLG